MLNTEGTARAIENVAKKRVCQWDLWWMKLMLAQWVKIQI
jgi:hypothetical protein